MLQKNFEKTIQVETSNIDKLKDELKPISVSVLDFFQYLRLKWIKQNVKGNDITYIEKVLGKPISKIVITKLSENKKKKMDKLIKRKNYNWGDINFHITYRITTHQDIIEVLEKIEPQIEDIIKKGYNVSIMPLALVTKNKDLLFKFVLKKDFFTDHISKSWDPYGIFSRKVKLFRKGFYLASQKFKRSVLMNITSACPFGCVGCYKGFFTRIIGKKFYTDLQKAVSKQAKLLVEHLNKHPEIKTVIVSGGEPLLLSNDGWKKMLQEFLKTKYLGEFRICTGVIFQGLPFRINDELLDMLESFENETGIKVNFNAHLGHPEQFTPESLIAIRKIIKKGFPINSQIPLQRGVNIFIENFDKTMNILYQLAQLQGISGVRPYKYILHMNVGSLEYSVPLEFMLEVLAELKYRIDHPWPETWQPVSFCILYQKGNILLSPQILYTIKKEVHKDKDYIVYRIPIPIGERKWLTVKYIESLLKGYNDDPDSLKKFKV
jgi:L-lysine 2,3-aminomutase